MKRIVLFLAIIVFLCSKTNAQCIPDPIFTMSPIPGVYPPEVPIAGIPMVGIFDGIVGDLYSQTLRVINFDS